VNDYKIWKRSNNRVFNRSSYAKNKKEGRSNKVKSILIKKLNDKKTLRHIARLSRISLTDEELEKFTPQMQTILDSAKVFKRLILILLNLLKRHIPFSQLREDIPEISLTQEDVLKNAKYQRMDM
jgi:aspartyl-tRNA(Asn)/glutamyl-tRNA(Gln) amidotransferase subunit C